jgi:dTDP-4-amino-4,6-dideoxygalactose transaminase
MILPEAKKMKQASRTLDRLVLPSDQDSSGRTLGAQELELLEEVVNSGTLTSTKGQFVKRFERGFAELLGVEAAWACSSGSAALHAAVAAIDPEPGDEIVTTAITDMGALTPILYQAAIPVFADIDPRSYNVTAETIAAVLSPRTKGIIVTHLFGNPCEMGSIMELARSHGIPVIEDCAQAFGARVAGQPVGAIGDIGCFSLQQGKHITTGEGGIVTTNNADYARRMFLFINKAWGYGDPNPDHYFLALNYRLSELQGAVALAQLSKLGDVVASRVELANRLTSRLAEVPGLGLPTAPAGSLHSYWKYCLDVDPIQVPGGAVALGAVLKEHGVASAPRYIQKPAFRCAIFQEQRTFGRSRFPFTLAHSAAVDYDAGRYAGTFSALERMLVLPWNERYTSEQVDDLAELIDHAMERLATET